ncbi:MAG: energy transducer TonB [Candidatus Acidiferrales bacterium]|jgi:protein TonB
MSQQIFFLNDIDPVARPRQSIVLPPMHKAQQDVLAEALLEKSSTRQKRNPLKWAASLGAHIAVLTVLLLLPLYFSQGLNLQKLNSTLLIAPPPPAAAPPPPPIAAEVHTVRSIPKTTFAQGKLTAPSFVPKTVATTPDAGVPDVAIAGISGGVPGGIPGGQIGGILGSVMGGVAAPAAPSAMSEGPKKPVRVGGDVKPPRLLSGPAPVYPILARQSHVGGIVVIEAIIDEHGNVVQEKVISGHPLLVQAALKAVSERKYEPTILDGEPQSVDLRVEVNFEVH